MESLAQLEALCERLYNSRDSFERAQAERTLRCFSVDAEYISQCQYILDNSSTSYALMLASSSLLKQVTEKSLPLQLRLDIRNYIINYLAVKGPGLEPFVMGSLIQLLCRVTKFGWLDDDRFREVVKESMNFLNQMESHHYCIGLKVLNQLVSEMHQPSQGLPSVLHRRIASSFRDQLLLQIFQISLSSLSQLKNEGGSKLQELALSLALQCLSFDFQGISFDESSEDSGTTLFPNSWRPVIEEPSTVQIFLDYYVMNQSHLSKDVLECLVRLTSARRSLLTDDARSKFLKHLVSGTKDIMQTGFGLADHDNYHVFCRLLSRFKASYQLRELVNTDCYSDWIRLVADLTLKSLQSWQWASSSLYHILGLWSKLVAAIPYTKGNLPSQLDEYAPRIIEAFISSRVDLLKPELLDEDSEDPLDNVELLQDRLDFLPYLFRFQNVNCTAYIVKIVEPVLLTYMEIANHHSCADDNALSLLEAKLAWAVHIIAAIVKNKNITNYSGESQDHSDAELSACVFRLINVSDNGLHSQRYGKISKQRLERALLTFFQCFRKSYLSDQAHQSSKMYVRLSELLGMNDPPAVLTVIAQKIATNLKSYYESVDVIDHTLTLFSDLASGTMTGKLLMKFDTINFVVSHHNRAHFRFLGDYRFSRTRTTFYYIITSLIFMEENLPKFKSSMESHVQVFASLDSTPDAMFRSDTVKHALIGLMRDLRGIAMATRGSRTYSFFFNWIYPAHMPILIKAVIQWIDTPEVTTPLLKFFAELVLNKAQRLNFESSSPNGILLFREASKLVVAYGSGILSLPNHADMYTFKYKGISICLTILHRAMSGKYVNFGVFDLYGDRALVDALDIIMKMILSIPFADILVYKKLMAAYFAFLDTLLSNHLAFVSNLDTSTFVHIIKSLHSGLKSSNANIASQCASAIDSLATSFFTNIIMGESPTSSFAHNLARHVADCPILFQEILKSLFEVLLYEDLGNHWSLSRPMLSLILLSEEMFLNLKGQILSSRPLDQQQRLSRAFDELMTDVTRSLHATNRDKFTRNLQKFRNEFRAR